MSKIHFTYIFNFILGVTMVDRAAMVSASQSRASVQK